MEYRRLTFPSFEGVHSMLELGQGPYWNYTGTGQMWGGDERWPGQGGDLAEVLMEGKKVRFAPVLTDGFWE
jgi:hypothetical protein